MTCAELREAAPELALGILTGPERARALAHLERCSDCQADVEDLTLVVDGVVGLTPAVEPPVGFEDGALHSFVPHRQHPRFTRRRTSAAAVAALILAAGGWAIGSYVTPSRPVVASATATTALREARLTAGGRWVGDLYAHPGPSPWLYVHVQGLGDLGAVTCQLSSADGRRLTVGTFVLDHGSGFWGGPIAMNPTTIRGARLLKPTGTVLATATFRTNS